jgi:hypothetical protein
MSTDTMGATEKALIPVLGFLCNLACPTVPAIVWTMLITAVASGDLDPTKVESFLKEHGITEYHNLSDFPNAPPGSTG